MNTSRIILCLSLCAALAATACARRPDPATLRAQIAAMDFSQAQQALLVADFRNLGPVGVLGKGGVNGDVVTWRSPDGVSLSLDHGVLVRAVGIGKNLLIADAAPTKAALAGQGDGSYDRVYKNLTADNQIRERVFRCTMSAPQTVAVRVTGKATTAQERRETCESATETIQNRFWTVAGRGLVKSDQWLPDGGYVTLDVPLALPAAYTR